MNRPKRAGSRNPRRDRSIYELSFMDKKDKYGELKPILDDPARPKLNISATKNGNVDNAYVLGSSRQSPKLRDSSQASGDKFMLSNMSYK